MARAVTDILRGVRFIGLSTTLASLRYAVRRSRQDARYRRTSRHGETLAPGKITQACSIPQGARFYFEQAELEILYLAPDLIRVSWTPGEPPVPYAISDRSWEGDTVELVEQDGLWCLEGTQYYVEVKLTGEIHYATKDRRTLREELAPRRKDQCWELEVNIPEEAVILGLGERAAGLNLRGNNFRFWNLDPGGSYPAGRDPLYLCIPVYLVLQDAGSYLVFHENAHDGQISFGERAQLNFERGMLRSYWMPGPPRHALARYSDLTGRSPLPPRWALGYHQSRWGYSSQDEVCSLAARFNELDLPLDAIHLDLDYMRGKRVFTIDENRFPDLTPMAADLETHGVHLVTILDPGVKVERGFDVYESGQMQDAFCRLPGGQLAQAPVWPGWSVFPDFSKHAARMWWTALYPRLLDHGISGIWHDMNEPSAFSAWGEPTLPLATQHSLDGQAGDHRSGHNLYGLLMNQTGFEALRLHNPGARPFLLSRSGWAGVQRYAWIWTGDTESSWEMLSRTIATLLGLGVSGIPFVGSDIGGFSGKPSAELYLRWLQMAAFTPFFRTHSSLGTPRREPWSFDDETLRAVRAALQLRRRLMPYIYTQVWHSCQEGIPLMRPMFWDDPNDPSLWEIDDQFMLGDALLVAPVVTPGATERSLSLPSGTWYVIESGEILNGPARITLPVVLDRIPILVKGGSVLPLDEESGLNLLLALPGEGEAGLHYQDAGDGYGEWQLDRYMLETTGNGVTLSRNIEGNYPLAYAQISLEPVGWKVADVEIDGRILTPEAGRFQVNTFAKLLLHLD